MASSANPPLQIVSQNQTPVGLVGQSGLSLIKANPNRPDSSPARGRLYRFFSNPTSPEFRWNHIRCGVFADVAEALHRSPVPSEAFEPGFLNAFPFGRIFGMSFILAMQRARYRACGNKTRLEAYPALLHTARPYYQSDEPHLWQFARVQRFLAQSVWTRRVDKVGQISLFSSTYSVGRAYKGQDVNIQLDIDTHEWVIETEQGQYLKRYPCQEITPERIDHFDLAKRANMVSCHAG